jgi:hypothetical protein
MGLINLATKFPRYAKVIGMGFKSGRMMSAADDMLMQAGKLQIPIPPYPNASISKMAQAGKLETDALRMTNQAKVLDRAAQRHSLYNQLDANQSVDAFNDAQKLGQTIHPYLKTAENIGRPAGRMATAAMMNPIGQMALYTGLPLAMYSMAGSGEQQQPESYQEMGSVAPSMMPSASYQDAYAPTMGMPATPQLDEEQIRKARRRAEEQAALNQFYAQALTQYQPYN